MPEPGHMLLKQQDTRKLYGTKNCCTYLQLGQIVGKRYRAQKLSRRFWRARSENRLLEAKAGHQVYTLHAAPPAGCANRLSHPSCLAMDARPPSPHRGTSLPPGGASKQGNLLFVPTPPCCSWGPSKALWIPDVESKSPLDTWCKNISWKMNIKTGHGTVDLLGYIPKCPNLFYRK